MKTEIEKMLAQKVFEPAQTEWAAPIFFAPKKHGNLRFCVYYRRLDTLTKRDSYAIPITDECIDALSEPAVFFILNAISGYWKVEIEERDHDKTTFASNNGSYRFTRKLFALENLSATFQCTVDVVLLATKWQFAFLYLNDIVIYSKSPKIHICHVRIVLALFIDAGVTMRLKKFKRFTRTINYLSHVIRPRHLGIASHTTDAVRGTPIIDKLD